VFLCIILTWHTVSLFIFRFLLCFWGIFSCLFWVVSISASDCLERLVSEMTYRLLCVEMDVKLYSLRHSLTHFHNPHFFIFFTVRAIVFAPTLSHYRTSPQSASSKRTSRDGRQWRHVTHEWTSSVNWAVWSVETPAWHQLTPSTRIKQIQAGSTMWSHMASDTP